MGNGPLRELLQELEVIAAEAGHLIASMRAAGTGWQMKSDGSPVTDADRYAEDLILTRLEGIADGAPVVAEERVAAHGAPDQAARRFFLVDPLDGTKEFVKGSSDYTVNIALIEDHVPVAGVVVAPARATLYSGAGGIATRACITSNAGFDARTRIRARCAPAQLVAVASVSHANPATDEFMTRAKVASRVAVGSSLKFCLVACGEADVYPRLGRTMQWDTAAGDAVVRSAGGVTLTRELEPLCYGPRKLGSHPFENPEFVAFGMGSPELAARLKPLGWS